MTQDYSVSRSCTGKGTSRPCLVSVAARPILREDGTMARKICRTCHQEFFVRDSHAHKRFNCSRACLAREFQQRLQGTNNPNYREHAARHCVCLLCGRAYTAQNKGSKYCSIPCRAEATRQATDARGGPKYQRGKYPRSSPHRSIQLLLPFTSPRRAPRTGRKRQCTVCARPFLSQKHAVYCATCRYVTIACIVCSQEFTCHRTQTKTTCSDACSRQALSDRQRGEKSHRWQGGKTPEAVLRRTRKEYDAWRTAVFQRDDFTCALCQQRGGKLSAHHIKRYALFPELAYCLWNGITLCWACHNAIHWKEHLYEDQFLASTTSRMSADETAAD